MKSPAEIANEERITEAVKMQKKRYDIINTHEFDEIWADLTMQIYLGDAESLSNSLFNISRKDIPGSRIDTAFICFTGNNGTLFHLAVHEASPGIVQLLLNHGADVNLRNDVLSGDTPLHTAVKRKEASAAMIELLLENGADDKLKNSDFQTPLELAKQLGNTEAVGTLQNFKAQATKLQANAAAKAEVDRRYDFYVKVPEEFKEGVEGNNIEKVRSMLADNEARKVINVNSPLQVHPRSITPLEEAVTNGNLEMVNLLLQNGAGQSPAERAAPFNLAIEQIKKGNYEIYVPIALAIEPEKGSFVSQTVSETVEQQLDEARRQSEKAENDARIAQIVAMGAVKDQLEEKAATVSQADQEKISKLRELINAEEVNSLQTALNKLGESEAKRLINLCYASDETPTLAHDAATTGNGALFKVLEQYGVDNTIQNCHLQTAKGVLVRNQANAVKPSLDQFVKAGGRDSSVATPQPGAAALTSLSATPAAAAPVKPIPSAAPAAAPQAQKTQAELLKEVEQVNADRKFAERLAALGSGGLRAEQEEADRKFAERLARGSGEVRGV